MPVTEYTVKAWILALKDFSAEKIQRGLIHCLQEHQSSYYPSTGEFRWYCNEAGRNKESWNDHAEVKMLEQKPTKSIPMPDDFREFLKKFIIKTTIHDALGLCKLRQDKRQQEERMFFSHASA
jgi:hypothetical protein